MAESIGKRIDITRFDKTSIDQISSDIVRALTEIAEKDPDANGAFHLKIGISRPGSAGPAMRRS